MRLSKKGWVILTTLTVIALVFAFYFFVYVKDKESQLIANKMRVLSQIRGNIELLIQSEKKVRQNQLKELEDIVVGTMDNNLALADNWTYLKDSISNWPFLWGQDQAIWNIDTGYFYKQAYQELFGKELIERKDEFEFIAIVAHDTESIKTLFSNFPLGIINFPQDSSLFHLSSKTIFELDFGYNPYLVFKTLIAEQADNQVYLIGFVDRSQFNEEKREVSLFIITISVILLTLMTLGLPLLKIYVMSNTERLGARDVFLAGASLILTPTIVVLFFFLFLTNIFSDKPHEESRLMRLNQQLATNFKTEVGNALNQLTKVRDSLPVDLFWIRQQFGREKTYIKNPYGQHVFPNAWKNEFWNDNFKYFNSIFWTDKAGIIKIYLSSEENPTKIDSLGHRTYIMDIIKGKGVSFKGETLAFESIRSVSDGNYEIGIGIPSENPDLPVLATSFSLLSLMAPIMESGYGFCLFNKQGLTLFHSDMKRNLNEDFLMETDQVFNPYISVAVDHFTPVRYMGKDHYMYVQELQDLGGFYLATFLEQSNTYSPNAIALNTTAEMQMVFLLLMFFIYWVLFLLTRKRNKLKQKMFIFYWLRPLTLSGKNSFLYRRLLLFNLGAVLYLIIMIGYGASGYYPPELLLYSLIGTGAIAILLNFWGMAEAFPEKERIYNRWFTFRKSGKIWLLMGLYIFLLIVGRIYLSTEAATVSDLLLALLVGGGIWLILRRNKTAAVCDDKRSVGYYKIYASSLVVLFSVAPTLLLFCINYNMEQDILFKSQVLSLKERIDNWETAKAAQFYKSRNGTSQPTVGDLKGFVQQMADNNSLAYAVPPVIQQANLLDMRKVNPAPNGYAPIYQVVRFEFDQYGLHSRALVNSENRASMGWSFVDGGVYFPRTSERISGPIERANSLLSSNGRAVTLFFVLLIVLIYLFVSNVIHRIFGLDYKMYADKMVLPRNYAEIGEKLKAIYQAAEERNDAFNNSFIVGVDASHVFDLYDSLQQWKGQAFYSLDIFSLGQVVQRTDETLLSEPEEYFSNLYLNYRIPIRSLIESDTEHYEKLSEVLFHKNQKIDSAPILIFIEHFEFAYYDLLLNQIKIDILQRLVCNPNIRLIVSSEISPTKMLELYEAQINEARSLARADRTQPNNDHLETLVSVYKQWLQLFGAFYRITIPIEIKNTVGLDCVRRELRHGPYLHRINHKYQVLYPNIVYCDDYILNVQETAYTYYYAIWNSLSSEERYIVYDVAQDGFVNTNNVNGIIDLLHKGILVYDHSLQLMNESFTNFVLSKVDSDEALEKELENNRRGNWSIASAVLILVIISLIAFVSLGKINILEDVNALLGSLAAIFAVFLRLGGMFVTGKAKE